MVGLFALQPDDDPAAIERLDIATGNVIPDEPQTVTLRDPVTGDTHVISAEMENIILILKSVGYRVVDQKTP